MQKFEGKLEVGGLVMIIGCNQPQNSGNIGKIATLEAIIDPGATYPTSIVPHDVNPKIIDYNPHKTTQCFVSGPGAGGGSEWCVDGIAAYEIYHIMPLPPLPEEETRGEKEKALEF